MRTPIRTLAAALLAAALLAAPASAIVRRHDRPDSLYRALAERPHAAGVVGGIAVGTLIAPGWVLTAAHVADGVSPFRKTVRFGPDEVPFDSIRYHPGAFADRATWVDLALLRLARPVSRVTPAPLAASGDDAGTPVLFLGTGRSGDGRTGPDTGDGAWRGARNRIATATPRVVTFRFDAPPEGEDLEGISGPGDSGGPAYVEQGGRLELVGVSSTNDSPDGQPACTYGTIETYARVSTQRAWIDSIQAGRGISPGSDWTPARDVAGDAGWPAGPVAEFARAWLARTSANDLDGLEALMQAHADSAALARRTPAERRKVYEETWSTWGPQAPVAVSERRDGTIAVLARCAKDGLWLDLRFWPSPHAPGKLARIGSIDLNAPGEPFAWPRR
jgi:hypothetical protein